MNTKEPADLILERTKNELALFRESRGKSDVYASQRQLTNQAIHDYQGRFIYELVQNGFDAHLGGSRDGTLSIILDELEGDHGVLYVANGGRPFTEANFRALCNVALSDKNVAESIGNKGIGFKSVLQVCECPEVYSSRAPDSLGGDFDGFCFTFANESEILQLVEGDEELAGAVTRDVLRYLLPVPLLRHPQRVHELAHQRYSTVIRLPLRSQRACELTAETVRRLGSSDVPLLIFLDRIAELKIEVSGPEGTTSIDLTRASACVHEGDDLRVETVNLGDKGEYLLASVTERPERVQAAIRESLEDQLIDEQWTTWEGSATVSIASRTDQDRDRNLLYTFLPMGSGARCPFNGYGNAPFFTRLARDLVDSSVPFNRLLLDSLARAAAATVLWLSENDIPARERIMVDLIAWDSAESATIRGAFAARGFDLAEADIIPVVANPSGRQFGSLNTAFSWDDQGLQIMTGPVIAQHTSDRLLDPSINGARRQRLDEARRAIVGSGLEPGDKTLGDWAAAVAAMLVADQSGFDQWDAFYDDLALAFKTRAGALAGRAIILDEAGLLSEANRIAVSNPSPTKPRAYFYPNQQSDDEDVDEVANLVVPAFLKARMALTNPGLTWVVARQTGGRDRKQSREFLSNSRLIRDYRQQPVLDHVRDALTSGATNDDRAGALEFVYRLQRTTRQAAALSLDTLGLRVPTIGGWLPATEAVFSRAWEEGPGKALESLIDRTAHFSDGLAEYRRRLVLSPSEWPFAVDNLQPWRDFLARCGVRSGLWPIPVSEVFEARPATLTLGWVGRQLHVNTQDRSRWQEFAAQHTQPFPYPRTTYRADGAMVALPGQEDLADFDAPAKQLYASLILAGLHAWPSTSLDLGFKRRDHAYDARLTWPTPAKAFLSEGAWVPMGRPGERESRDFVRPREAWHFRDDADEREAPPPFMALIPLRQRRQIEAAEECRRRMGMLGLRVWNDPVWALDALAAMAEIVKDGGPGATQLVNLRKDCRRAWSRVVALNDPDSHPAPPKHLIVNRGEALDTWAPDGPSADVLYLEGAELGLKTRMAKSLRVPILVADGADAVRILETLKPAVGDRVRPLSAISLDVEVDGRPFIPNSDPPRLIDNQTAWLETLILLAIEYRSTDFRRSGHQGLADKIAALRSIHLVRANSIEITVDGRPATLPERLTTGVPIADPGSPTIILRSEEGALTWRDFEAIVPAVAQLLNELDLLPLLLLGLKRLAEEGEDANPEDESIAAALDLNIANLDELRAHLRSSLDWLADRVRVITTHYAGLDRAEAALPEDDPFESEGELAGKLDQVAAWLPYSPARVIELCKEASTLPELRVMFEISFGDFNRTLRSLAPAQTPIHDAEGHRRAVAAFLAEHREAILGMLRLRFMDEAIQGLPLASYVAQRTLGSIRPDDAWLDEYEVPSDEQIMARADAWLEDVGAQPMAGWRGQLEAVDEVRLANLAALRGVVKGGHRPLLAWCHREKVGVPAPWDDESPIATLAEQFGASGHGDFVRLDASAIMAWLLSHGSWPDGMPCSIELGALGLSARDLEFASTSAEKGRLERSLARQSLTISGEKVRVTREDYSDIAAMIRAAIPAKLLQTTSRPAELAHIEQHRKGSHRPDGDGRGRSHKPDQGLTQVQRDAIGLVGEVIAFAWLKEHYATARWRSGYSSLVLGGPAGDDTLGFDMDVPDRKSPLMFEVKATSGEDLEFELAESEIRRARQHAANDRYRVLFVRRAIDPEQTAIHVLPNPFGRRRERFRLIGSGLRYRFRLS